MRLQLSAVRDLMLLIETKGLLYALDVFVVTEVDCLADVKTMGKTTVIGLTIKLLFTLRKVTT